MDAGCTGRSRGLKKFLGAPARPTAAAYVVFGDVEQVGCVDGQFPSVPTQREVRAAHRTGVTRTKSTVYVHGNSPPTFDVDLLPQVGTQHPSPNNVGIHTPGRLHHAKRQQTREQFWRDAMPPIVLFPARLFLPHTHTQRGAPPPQQLQCARRRVASNRWIARTVDSNSNSNCTKIWVSLTL